MALFSRMKEWSQSFQVENDLQIKNKVSSKRGYETNPLGQKDKN